MMISGFGWISNEVSNLAGYPVFCNLWKTLIPIYDIYLAKCSVFSVNTYLYVIHI